MKLREMYELFIRLGIENDPRGEKEVKDLLTEKKRSMKNYLMKRRSILIKSL